MLAELFIIVLEMESFLPNLNKSPANNFSKNLKSLESSGLSPEEINQVVERFRGLAVNGDSGRGDIGLWIINYAIPSIVILGTGALFFLMTGGEDEPPSPLSPLPPLTTPDSIPADSLPSECLPTGDGQERLNEGYDSSPRNNRRPPPGSTANGTDDIHSPKSNRWDVEDSHATDGLSRGYSRAGREGRSDDFFDAKKDGFFNQASAEWLKEVGIVT